MRWTAPIAALVALVTINLPLHQAAAQTAQQRLQQELRLAEFAKQEVAAWRKTNPDMSVGGWDLKYGAEYLELGKFDDAEPYFRRTVASSPRNAYAHYFRGLALIGANRAADAAQEFELAGAINPALGSRGKAQLQSGGGTAAPPAPVAGKPAPGGAPAPAAGPAAPAAGPKGTLEWSGRVFSVVHSSVATGTLRISYTGQAATGTMRIGPPLAGEWALSGSKSTTLCELRGKSADGRNVEVRGSCTDSRFEGGYDLRGANADYGNLALEKGGRKESAPVSGSPDEQKCFSEYAACNARANAGRGFDNNSLAGVNDCLFQKTQCLARAKR